MCFCLWILQEPSIFCIHFRRLCEISLLLFFGQVKLTSHQFTEYRFRIHTSLSYVMAFLRSVTRTSRKISATVPSCTRSNELNLHLSRVVPLTSTLYNADIRRELSTGHKTLKVTPLSSSSSLSPLPTPSPSTPSLPPAKLNSRNVSSTTPAMAAAAATPPLSGGPPRDPLDVSFNNPIDAFKSKTTWELIRAYVVYLMCSSEYLVENNMKVRLKEEEGKREKTETIDLIYNFKVIKWTGTSDKNTHTIDVNCSQLFFFFWFPNQTTCYGWRLKNMAPVFVHIDIAIDF